MTANTPSTPTSGKNPSNPSKILRSSTEHPSNFLRHITPAARSQQAGHCGPSLTYVNVLIDQQGSRRLLYLPFHRSAEPLSAAVRKVWKGLGCEMRLVECTSAYRHFGCLHCLVNVLHRS